MIVPCHTATAICILRLQLQTHLVWGLGCFIDNNPTLNEPLQGLLDGQNACWAAALFCSLQTWPQGCCHTIYVLPGTQTAVLQSPSIQTTPPTLCALICKQELLPSDMTTCNSFLAWIQVLHGS